MRSIWKYSIELWSESIRNIGICFYSPARLWQQSQVYSQIQLVQHILGNQHQYLGFTLELSYTNINMTQMSFNILISFYSTCWISRWSRSPSLTILYRVNWTICTAYMWTVKVISGFSIEDNSIATLLSSILNLLVIPLAIYLHTTLNAISLPTKSRCNNFHKLPCKASPQPEFRFSSNKNMTYFQAHKQTNEAYETENPLSVQD